MGDSVEDDADLDKGKKKETKKDNMEEMVKVDLLQDEKVGELIDCSLAGKIWTRKNFNTKAFMNTILSVWHPKKKVEISELNKNLFMFRFESKKDREKILDNQLWHFERNIVVLQEISGSE